VDPLSLLWLFFILASVQPAVARQALALQRRRALARISDRREATVISLIHRQETLSFLGVPVTRYIDIDDAEGVLRAINETPPERPIEMILHTPGGLVVAARQIASALADHPAHVTAVVPHYAMSGGTLIALAADQIVVDPHATLGPVDPQLGRYAAASLVAVAALPGDHDDQTLIMADLGRKAIVQVEAFTATLLRRHMEPERARDVAHLLATGVWTHDHPLLHADLAAFGLPVRVGVGDEERDLLALYPQPRQSPSVEYVPGGPARPLPGRRQPRPSARDDA
jgi:ClpP class serine protease